MRGCLGKELKELERLTSTLTITNVKLIKLVTTEMYGYR